MTFLVLPKQNYINVVVVVLQYTKDIVVTFRMHIKTFIEVIFLSKRNVCLFVCVRLVGRVAMLLLCEGSWLLVTVLCFHEKNIRIL